MPFGGGSEFTGGQNVLSALLTQALLTSIGGGRSAAGLQEFDLDPSVARTIAQFGLPGGPGFGDIFGAFSVPQWQGPFSESFNPLQMGALELATGGDPVLSALFGPSSGGPRWPTGPITPRTPGGPISPWPEIPDWTNPNALPQLQSFLVDAATNGGIPPEVLASIRRRLPIAEPPIPTGPVGPTGPPNRIPAPPRTPGGPTMATDAISRLFSLSGGTGAAGGIDANMLRALAMGQEGERAALGRFTGIGPGTTNALTALSNLSFGGPQAQLLSQALGALEQQRRTSLTRDIGDIREQFSSMGLRFSEPLARAIGARQTESEQAGQAAGTQLAMQFLDPALRAQITGATGLGELGQGISAQQLQALTSAGGLGSATRGQGISALTNLLNTTTTGTGQQLQALGLLPGVAEGLATLPLSIGERQFGLGERARQISDQDILRQIGEFQRTQGALFGPLLNFAAGQPVIMNPSLLEQLSPFAALGAAAK